MSEHQFVILSRAKDGQQAEFERWYDEEHLGDVCKVPGVTGAQRYRITGDPSGGTPAFGSLAVYHLEGDDPAAVVQGILSRAYTPEMPISDAMETEVQMFLVEPAGKVTA